MHRACNMLSIHALSMRCYANINPCGVTVNLISAYLCCDKVDTESRTEKAHKFTGKKNVSSYLRTANDRLLHKSAPCPVSRCNVYAKRIYYAVNLLTQVKQLRPYWLQVYYLSHPAKRQLPVENGLIHTAILVREKCEAFYSAISFINSGFVESNRDERRGWFIRQQTTTARYRSKHFEIGNHRLWADKFRVSFSQRCRDHRERCWLGMGCMWRRILRFVCCSGNALYRRSPILGLARPLQRLESKHRYKICFRFVVYPSDMLANIFSQVNLSNSL